MSLLFPSFISLQRLNYLTQRFVWPDPLFMDSAGPIIEPERSPNGVQLHHIGRLPQKAELKIPRNPVHGCQHRSVGIPIHLERAKRETGVGNVMMRQPLLLQHSEKQIPMPAPQFGKLRSAQTGKKQHVTGDIVAEEHALATVEGEKMGVPAAQGTRLTIRPSLWVRQIAGGGNPHCQLLSAMENHSSKTLKWSYR